MRYIVMIRRTRSGYSADVPDLPGCVAAARTIETTRRQIGRAVAMHVESMRESGDVIPQPRRQMKFAADEDTEEHFCTWVDVKERNTRKPKATRR